MNFHRNLAIIFSLLAFFPAFLPKALAGAYDNLPADYVTAISNAQNHIDSPSGWIPTSGIVKITGDPNTENPTYGLTYDTTSYGSNYLVTRTLTQSSYYINSGTQVITGVGAYTTFNDSFNHQASWVTTGNSLTTFLDNNSVTSSNMVKLMERGLGMNNTGTHTAIVEYAVLPTNDYLIRPGLQPDIRSYSTTTSDYGYSNPFNPTQPSGMSTTTYAHLKTYLDYWQTTALGNWHTSPVIDPTSPFPWTQLGYTYFWGNGSSLNAIQGMSEFIILGGTSVYIYGIYSPQSYLYTKNNGEYGNGYANFNITGSCDTVWAGNTFQKKVSTSSASGSENTITIGTNGSVSGGQGILVWSLNYLVNNSGVISGATSNKFGLNNTSNIAVLFKGNADVAGAINQLTNSGTIASPGTAIESDAGATTITNTGKISGDDYAILTYSGHDTVNITAGEVYGKINLGGGTSTFTANGAKLGFTLDRDTDTTAYISNMAAAHIANTGAVTIAPTAGGIRNIVDNESFLIVDVASLDTNANNITVQNDSTHPMLTFTKSISGNQLSLVASRDNSYYRNNSANSSLGSVLDNLANTGTSDMSVIIGALDDTGSAANTQKLEPVAAAPVVNAVIEGLNNFGSVFSLQMAHMANEDNPDLEVYAANNNGKQKRLPASALDHMLAYNNDSVLENSFHRPQDWEVFATGFGVMNFQSDRGDAIGYKSNGGGTQVGFYRRVNDELMLGVLGGYMFDNVQLNGEAGSQDINSVRIGPCGKWLRGNLYATGAVTYGYHGVQANRKIDLGTVNRQADADYSMHDISPYLETGYIFHVGRDLEITPNISLQYDWMHSQSYNESGAGAADLSVEAFDSNSLVSVLGVRFNGRMDMGSVAFLPEFNVGWQHEYLGRSGDIQASFSSESAGTFTTNANAFDRNAVRLGVAANFLYGKKRNVLSFQYNTAIYDSASNHIFSITCRNYF